MSTYHIIEFEVAVDDGISVSGHVSTHVVHDLIESFVGSAQRLSGLAVGNGCLLGFDAREGLALAFVEVGLFAVALEADAVGFDCMEPGLGTEQ